MTFPSKFILIVFTILTLTLSYHAYANSTSVISQQSQPPPTFASTTEFGDYMSHIATPGTGCFKAIYPNPEWQRIGCSSATSEAAVPSSELTNSRPAQYTGAGQDFVAQSPSTLIGIVKGYFPAVTGLKSDIDVCVQGMSPCYNASRPYDGGSGPNAYGLQINSEADFPVTYDGRSTTGWEQFVFANSRGVSFVEIEFWLFNYGSTYHVKCSSLPIPSGASGKWFGSSTCYFNADKVLTPFESPRNLTSLVFWAYAGDGQDEAILQVIGGNMYTNSQPDSLLDLSNHWTLSEFNVFGAGGGSQVQFNSGTTITVSNNIYDSAGNAISPVAPCPDDGQTGESNNLALGGANLNLQSYASCTVSSKSGNIVFGETNVPEPSAITVQNNPAGVAFDPNKNEVFVANQGSGTVSVISDATNTVAANIIVGDNPLGLAFDPHTDEIFVANYGSNTVSVISDASNQVVATIYGFTAPYGVAVDNACKTCVHKVYVTNSGSDTVSVVSDETDAIIKNVTVGISPFGVAFDPQDNKVFVANYARGVSVISSDTDKLNATISLGSGASALGVAYDSNLDEIFVTDHGSNFQIVSVIDAATNLLVAAIRDPGFALPDGVAFDSHTNQIFVANNNGSANTVSVISDAVNAVVYTVSIGNYPSGVAFDSSKNEIFVTCSGLGYLNNYWVYVFADT